MSTGKAKDPQKITDKFTMRIIEMLQCANNTSPLLPSCALVSLWSVEMRAMS